MSGPPTPSTYAVKLVVQLGLAGQGQQGTGQSPQPMLPLISHCSPQVPNKQYLAGSNVPHGSLSLPVTSRYEPCHGSPMDWLTAEPASPNSYGPFPNAMGGSTRELPVLGLNTLVGHPSSLPLHAPLPMQLKEHSSCGLRTQ